MVGRVSSPRFVGRGEELAALEAALARVAEGVGSAVLVAGEAGIGKSRLISELRSRAQAVGATVLIGECAPVGEGNLPYAPLVGPLRSLVRELGEREIEVLPESTRRELARLLPELATDGADEAERQLSAGSQGRLFEQLHAVFASASRAAPIVLVVEDIHWADRSTLDFLAFLVRAARRERLLLVASYRSDELRRDHPSRRFVVELERSGQAIRIELSPFTREELGEQVATILGSLPERGLIDRLLERSEGNPFFCEELLISAGTDAAGLPRSLRDALLLRVDSQPPYVRRVLDAAAVAGRSVDHWLLEAVAGLEEDELTGALRTAIDDSVLVHDPGSTGYSFRHALVREALYADLLPGQRRALHMELARTLSERPELAGPKASAAAELAYHYHAAGQPTQALAASVNAAIAAEEIHAFAEALFHYQRALLLWDGNSDVAAELGLDRLEVMRRASEAANLAGATEQAIELVRGALERIDDHQDSVRAGLLRERLGSYLWHAGRGEDSLPEYRRAVELIPVDPPSEDRAFVLAAEAQALMLCNRNSESVQRCEESLEIARQINAQAVVAHVLDTTCENLISAGEFDGAVAAAAEATSIARRLGLIEEIARGYVNGSDALDVAGRVQESIALAREGIEVVRDLGSDRNYGDFLRAEVIGRLIRSSRWAEADQLLEELLDSCSTGMVAGVAHIHLGALRAEQGELEAASNALECAAELVARSGGSMWIGPIAEVRATIELWADRPAAAAEAISDCLHAISGVEHVFYTARLYELGARAHAELAARAPADEHLRAHETAAADALLERLDRVIGGMTGEPPPFALASRATVVAERSRLAHTPTPGPWTEAARAWEAFGNRYRVAYARWREAEAVLASGGPRRSAEPLVRDAHTVAEELGALPLATALQTLARSARIELLGENGSDETPNAALAHLELTPREIEVLALVADGLTNREIATRLYISDKTASVHVSHILSKLSVPNRASAATTAHRLGLKPPT